MVQVAQYPHFTEKIGGGGGIFCCPPSYMPFEATRRFSKPSIYALYRILQLQPTGKPFAYSEGFSPAGFFAPYYGITADEEANVEDIELKVEASKAAYLRSLPLHHSQREAERAEAYSIFRLRLAPAFDFEQKILSMGEYAEVLSPAWLRKRMAGRIRKAAEQYGGAGRH